MNAIINSNESLRALIVAQSAGLLGGPLFGGFPQEYATGFFYTSQFFTTPIAGGTTTTATRLYYMPILIFKGHVFTACETFNASAGDNGEKYRVGIYTHGTAGPGTLVGSFGEVTLTGAEAVRELTANVTVPKSGLYWLAVHFESATVMQCVNAANKQLTAAGYLPSMMPQALLGYKSATTALTDPLNSMTLYVDTTYGALASTAVAPTAALDYGIAVALKG